MLDRFFSDRRSDSKDIAKERLSKVLLKDRTSYSPEIIESLGADILNVLSNYMEFDKDETDIHISQEDGEDTPVLHMNVPIITMFNR